MRKNKLAFKLIDMGLRAETLANLTESQLRLLYNKLNESKKESNEEATYTEYSNDELNQGVDIDGGGKVTKTPTGVKVQHSEMKEDKNKKSKKYNPFALCTASVGRKDKEKYERCVNGIKESIKEGKDPINLFLEERIVSLLERHIQPKITKGEFLQMIKESETETPDKQREKEKIKTKPTTKPKPGHPGKNPNPGEHSAPKAGRISPEQAKDKIIGVIMNLLKKPLKGGIPAIDMEAIKLAPPVTGITLFKPPISLKSRVLIL